MSYPRPRDEDDHRKHIELEPNRALVYGSLFSGIGGFDLGFDRAGMRCAWQVEKDVMAQGVLTNHWPDIKKYREVQDVGKRNLSPVDLICGGFPCQDVSIAGRREGLAGERSGLWFEFSRIVGELKPQWVVIENVPGLLSSCGCVSCQAIRRILRVHKYLRDKRKITIKCPICNAGKRLLKSHRGRDLALILSGLEKLGYWWAYRVLDAQFFGVPQRRRRVFIVASLTKVRPQKVLFERDSSPWDTPPRREARPGDAGATAAGIGIGGSELGYALRSNHSHSGEGVNANLVIPAIALSNRGLSTGDKTETIRADSHGALPLVAFTQNSRDEVRLINGDGQITGAIAAQHRAATLNSGGNDGGFRTEPGEHLVVTPTLTGKIADGNRKGWAPVNEADALIVWDNGQGDPNAEENDVSYCLNGQANQGVGVRRLTPLECERLQGFPDCWTKHGIEAGKTIEQSDSARYRQLGNAVAVPVAKWIGQRIIKSLGP